jgi:hypothetical protein
MAKLDFFIELYKTDRIQLSNLTSFVLFANGSVLKHKLDSVGDANRLCGLVVRVLGYRSGGPGSIPGTTRKKR